MNLFQRLFDNQIARLGYAKAADIKETVLFRGETVPGQDENLWADWRLEHFQKLAMVHPVFFSNLKLIADTIAIGQATIEEKTGPEQWEGIEGHPFEIIIEERPNPYQSQSYAWWYQVIWLIIQGEAFWMLVKDGTGELVRMYPLPANRVKPIPDPDKLFKGFAYTPVNGQPPILLDPDQICFHRLPNPFDYHRGFSLLNAFLEMLKLSQEANKFDLEDYQNGLTLRTLISLRPELSRRDKLQFEADIEAANRDGKRYLIARGGDIDAQQLASRRDDKAGQETVHERVERIANLVLGIPDGMRARNANQANIDSSYSQFIELTVWPMMSAMAEDMTAQIIIPNYGDGQRMVFKDIRQKNIELEIKEKESKRGVQTFDEAREAEGIDPYHDPEIGQSPYVVLPELFKGDMGGEIAMGQEGELETLPQLALNGAQVTAALQIVEQVNLGTLSRESAQGSLEIMFNLTTEQADRILGNAGKALPFIPNGKLKKDKETEQSIADELQSRSAEYIKKWNNDNPDFEIERNG